jgi:DNA-cytosine methyltransferase
MTLKIGSLFSGYGGLDLAVSAVTGGEVVWHCEFDPAASKVLEKNFPNIPNFGDIKNVDWSKVEPIDILIGGFPCQDVSLAGKRAGMFENTRSGLWLEFYKAINLLKPKLIIIENVRGLLSANADNGIELGNRFVVEKSGQNPITAAGAVFSDLARIGFDAKWASIQATDAGSCHARFRIFIVAYPVAYSEHNGF